MSNIKKTLVMRIAFAFAIVLVVALALTAMISTAGADNSQGSVTIKGADTPVFPTPVVTSNTDNGMPAVPDYNFGTISITGSAMFALNIPPANNPKSYIRTVDLTGSESPFNVTVQLGTFSDGSSHTIDKTSITLFTEATTTAPTISLIPSGTATWAQTGLAGYVKPDAPEEHNPDTNALIAPATNVKVTGQGGISTGVTLVAGAGAQKILSANRNSGAPLVGKGMWWLPTKAVLYIPAEATGVGSYSYTATLTWTLVVGSA